MEECILKLYLIKLFLIQIIHNSKGDNLVWKENSRSLFYVLKQELGYQ